MKTIIEGTISVQKWTNRAYIAPKGWYTSLYLGPRLSETASDGSRAVAVITEKENGRVYTEAVFEVNVSNSYEGVVERAEAWLAKHPW